MTLTAGNRLGLYEILSAIGTGGMGEVYRARDTKLNRDVAIKVLLRAVANDPDRLARFSREAVLASSVRVRRGSVGRIGPSTPGLRSNRTAGSVCRERPQQAIRQLVWTACSHALTNAST